MLKYQQFLKRAEPFQQHLHSQPALEKIITMRKGGIYTLKVMKE